MIESMTLFNHYKVTDTCNSIKLDEKFARLWNMVGRTPMVKLCYRYKGKESFIYVKCEQYNLTGSIKDRVALYILQQAYKQGVIQPGYRIIEATSGNTGISFAAIGKALGHRVKIIIPDWLSKERMDIIKSHGASIMLISKEQGGFKGSIELTELLAKEHANVFLPRQFANPLNCEAHEKTTAPEIWQQLQKHKIKPAAFVAGVGTGGTVMGVGRFLQSQDKSIQIFPLEPAESPTLSTGFKNGSHRIQGISDEFIPSIVKLDKLGKVLQAHDGDAILMAQKLAAQLGLAVGISSGANVIGAIKIKEELGKDACVVTLFPDCNKKYLTTDLMKVEPEKDSYLTPQINFFGYQPLDRI
jgi:cysteine synthase A